MKDICKINLHGMRIHVFTIILCLSCIATSGVAQHQSKIDKWLEILQSSKNDTVKLDALNNLGFAGDDYGLLSKQYIAEALQLSSLLRLKNEKAFALLNQSFVFNKTGKYDSSLLNILKANQIYNGKDSVLHARFYARYYFALGMLTLPQGNDKDGTLQNFLTALRFAKLSNDAYLISVCYGAVGKAYNYLRQFDKSIESNKEYLAFAVKGGDTLILAKAHQNLSAAYLNAGNISLHETHDNEFAKLVTYLKNPQFSWLLINNRGLAFAEKGMIKEALIEALHCIEFATKQGLSANDLVASYYAAAYCLNLSGEYQRSNEFMKKVEAMADSSHLPEYKMYAASGMAENYFKLNDFKNAYEYLSKQLLLSDSLSSEKVKINSNYLHIKNKIEQKENLIKQQENTIRKNKTIQYLMAGGIFLIILLAMLGYKYYRQRKKNQEQRIQELETEKQLLSTQSLLKGQEEERSRIAKDLHDGLGGLLSGVKLQLGAMKGNLFLSEENGHAFNRALDKLDESISEMRRVAHNMMPETLLKFGLRQALSDYCNGLSYKQTFTIDCEFRGLENRISQSTEVVIYRIVQELINNAIKHSGASHILVQLIQQDEENLNITVEDNGKGFDASQTTAITAGLRNVSSRVKYLNGKMDIQSQPGNGTSVYIECKLNANG